MPILKFCGSPVPHTNFLRPESYTDLQLKISLQGYSLELQGGVGGGVFLCRTLASWELPGVGLQKNETRGLIVSTLTKGGSSAGREPPVLIILGLY